MAKKKTTRSKTTTDAADKIDFETSLAEVEQIVARLESGELNLTESLEQYEIGIKRLKQCHGLLEAAEQRVSLLAGFDADGNPVTESLRAAEGDATGEAASVAGRAKEAEKGGEVEDRALNRSPGVQDRVDDSPGLF